MRAIRTGALLAVAAMFVGMLALPASAAHTNTDIGIYRGVAAVGKTITSGECANDSYSPTLGGGGLGFPILHAGGKTGWWTITVVDGFNGDIFKTVGHLAPGNPPMIPPNILKACGELHPGAHVSKGGIGYLGAACGISTSKNGFGKASFADGTFLKLRNLNWIISAGGTLPVQGRTVLPDDTDKKRKAGHVVALTQAQGGLACTTKSGTAQSKTGGAPAFDVVGIFAAVS